jgi:hypothetical protein
VLLCCILMFWFFLTSSNDDGFLLVEVIHPFFADGLPFVFLLTLGAWIKMAICVPATIFFWFEWVGPPGFGDFCLRGPQQFFWSLHPNWERVFHISECHKIKSVFEANNIETENLRLSPDYTWDAIGNENLLDPNSLLSLVSPWSYGHKVIQGQR